MKDTIATRCGYYVSHGLAIPKDTYELVTNGKPYNHALDPNFIDVCFFGTDNIDLPDIGECTVQCYPCIDMEPVFYIISMNCKYVYCIKLYENRYALNTFNPRNMLTSEQTVVFNNWFTEKKWKFGVKYWDDNPFTLITVKEKPDYSIILPPNDYEIESKEKYRYKCDFNSMWHYMEDYKYI